MFLFIIFSRVSSPDLMLIRFFFALGNNGKYTNLNFNDFRATLKLDTYDRKNSRTKGKSRRILEG